MASLPATHPVIGTSADDNITGTRRSDVIAGMTGDDTITGQTGHDEVWGGQGNDELYGNSGNDRIYGSGGPTIINVSTIPIGNDYPVRVIFEGETAGYRNSFGYYKIDSATKEIYDVEIIWPNASLQGSGGDLVAGQSDALLDVQAGDNVGFFIVSNGFSYNDFAALGEGTYAFQNANGTPATLDSDDPKLVFETENGETTEIVYHQYHTAAYDETLGLNPDGLLHTAGILKTDKGTLTIGFEDLLNGGDLDFDDSVFTIDLGPANAVILNAHYRQEHGLPDLVASNEGNGEPIIVIEDDDILRGGTGNDELWGHKGNDLLYGDNGTDEMHGGSGDDILHGGSGDDEMYGNLGNDFIYGDSGSDYMVGGSGDDYIEGGNYNDSLIGGSGNDTLKGGSHHDDLAGNSGNDLLYGENGNDRLEGGSGDDTLDGGSSQDTLLGGSGNDLLVGGSGHDRLEAGSGNDSLKGGSGTDSLFGHSGNDVLDGGSGSDLLDGGSGIDTADYSDWSKKISVDLKAGTVKGNGTDILVSIENIFATGHDDKIIGDHRENEIHAGDGADRVSGHAGNDLLYGGNGEDYLNGASGADVLFGGADDDLLRGGKGADEITGGTGDDILWGGENGINDQTTDTFYFTIGDGSDSIADFEVGMDLIALSDLLVDESDDLLSALSDTSEGAVLDLSAFNGQSGDSILFTSVTVDELNDEAWHIIV
ncbi:DUF4114 domain-containing protein [Pelagibius sp. Alg239-R121]|uniref:DUF4114 domain-containing protein n=1 Tax=Pelagibius sp. Alg239-R121 TaxID=2993448 RepID=UPI0024A7141C|nr:DUF4114 domain-containing protein [Pelagibius sp. Alg239-R121]